MSAFRALLTHIYNYPDQRILIHCSFGKDRTGLLFALLLSLAGVPDDTMAVDYCLSPSALELHKPQFQRLLRVFKRDISEQQATVLIDRILTSRPDYILLALRKTRHTYGGVYQYIREKCLMADDVIECIRASLIQTKLE